jgi:hypothetical protein
VVAEEEIVLSGSKLIPEGKCIKILFYKDEINMLYFMIGIGKIESSDSEQSDLSDFEKK